MKPGRGGPRRIPQPLLAGNGHHRLGLLLAFLALVVIAGLVAYLVVRITSRRTLAHAAVAAVATVAPVTAPSDDAALQQLRLRYAQGEVGRSDFLQALTDLGAPPPPPVTNAV